jgi:tripartite motif-containing protein 71
MRRSKSESKLNQKILPYILFSAFVGFGSDTFNAIADAKQEVQYVSELKTNLKEPVDVAISDSGDIYVLDKKLAQVVVFDREGKVKMDFGSKGSVAGKMHSPESIALSRDKEIIITDTGNKRILVFKPNGKFAYVLGSQGTNPGEFMMPNCVAVNPSGYIYVSDRKNKTLSKFTPKGVFLDNYALGHQPDDVLFDRQNNLYILFSKNGKIVKYDAAMEMTDEITLIKDTKDLLKVTNRVAVDHRGDIYLVEMDDKRVVKMAKDRTIALVFGSGGSGRGQFNHALGIATDKEDTVYIADSKNKRVQIFKLTGVEQTELEMSACEAPLIEYVGSILASQKIVDIDYVPNDGLYAVTEIDDDLIYRGDNRDILKNYEKNENKLKKPKGLCVLQDGNIIVADTGNNQLQFISANGTNEYRFGVKGKDISQFNALEGVAVDKLGYIYVADTKNHRIQVFNEDGIYMHSFGEKSVAANTRAAPGTFLYPKDLVFSATDELYVLDYGNKRVQVLDPQGKYLREIGGVIDDVKFINPIDIAMDEKNYLYVADRGRHAVIILDEQGKELLSFGSNGKGPSYFPRLTSIDSSSGKIYVSDYFIDEVRVFNFLPANPFSTALGETAMAGKEL